ncbi:MAG: DUF6079 family protein [Pyrinomonadaceae bacterium]
MDRINEKVKDLIEVRRYQSLVDFSADAGETLRGYHFTDITSQLMANWIDTLVDLRARKTNAKALAGYRGVGKSHFLSAFSAVLSHPELRSAISEQHVSASAHLLMRRRYPVAIVRRGTRPSLKEELYHAVSEAIGVQISELPEELDSLMSMLDDQHPDVPISIIVDTALERENRVARDDGAFLGEIAEAVREKNIFVGVALDDDITGADGINAAIARSYTIDYLDQEHLYKIVDSHIFRKHRQSHSLIRQIYQHFRESLPAFKWSEPRFTSLYPLHPGILEIAPFVRLYSPEFALLGFASEAGARIMGRPANSLIALDEVFDKVEDTLRKAPDLNDAFTTYDEINKSVISTIPVMQRLQAKLILKALFVLSLDGDGTTASEISAAMLIYDEGDITKGPAIVGEILERFFGAFPKSIHRRDDGEEPKFSFRVSGKDDLSEALAEKTESVSDDVIPALYRKVMKDRYPDWNLSLEESGSSNWTDCTVVWRGGGRRARITWSWNDYQPKETASEGHDFEITIVSPDQSPDAGAAGSYFWQPAELSQDEKETLKRYHLLLNDEELKAKYHDQVRAAGHTHSINLTKIWERVFLTEGTIIADGLGLSFPPEAIGSESVGETLSLALTPQFDMLYPEHPEFDRTLELKHVATLVNDLLSGARVSNIDVQDLAGSFAAPLGIVCEQDGGWVLEKEEVLLSNPIVSAAAKLVESAGDVLGLPTAYAELGKSPYGLVREASQLVFSALVAARRAEFVTAKGDRIQKRSLDLKIIWDDIAGIAKPVVSGYSNEKLGEWAALLAKSESLPDISNPETRNEVIQGLISWLEDWEEMDVVKRFSLLPDEILNTRIWQISVNVERAFDGVADAVRALRDSSIQLENCLERIIDGFSASEAEYESREQDLVSLVSFIKSVALRETIWGYLAISEKTNEPEVESLRSKLKALLESAFREPSAATNKQIGEVWKEFHGLFSEHFAVKHDSIMRSHQLQEKFDEFTKSDAWWEYERLSTLPIFQQGHRRETDAILRQLRQLDCSFDVRDHLKLRPFCACSFNLSKMNEWEDLPGRLANVVAQALLSYRRTLDLLRPDLQKRLEELVKEDSNPEHVKAGCELLDKIKAGEQFGEFNHSQLTVLLSVLGQGKSTEYVNAKLPELSEIATAASMRTSLDGWLKELPADPVFIKLSK